MKAYTYDYNGKFSGSIELEKDPVNEEKRKKKSDLPEKFLVPAYATLEKPVIPNNHEAFYDGSKWVYKEIMPVVPEEKPPEREIPYTEKRLREYPPASDYLDGVVKTLSGDKALEAEGNAQIKKYVADCMAVKAKYPKDK